jgi:hypothetical protein
MIPCLLLLAMGLPGTWSVPEPGLVQARSLPIRSGVALSAASGTPESSGSPAGPNRSRAPRERPPTGSLPRPRLSGSSTGYVENAIIGSQIRIRFDAGFGEDDPDLAEFFYAKCGCFRELGVDPKAPGPAPKVDPDSLATAQIIETGIDFQELRLEVEYAPRPRLSVFGMLPVRSIQPEVNGNATGIGDITGGFKLGLVATPEQAVTFQFRTYTNSGNARKGLGTHHWSLEPALLYHGALTERFAAAAEFGAWLPIKGSLAIPADSSKHFAGHVLRFGVGASYDAFSRPGLRLTPVLELVGWHVLDGYVTRTSDGTVQTGSLNRAAGTKIMNLKLGGRLTLRERTSVYLGYGHALTKRDWYSDILRLEYRYVL